MLTLTTVLTDCIKETIVSLLVMGRKSPNCRSFSLDDGYLMGGKVGTISPLTGLGVPISPSLLLRSFLSFSMLLISLYSPSLSPSISLSLPFLPHFRLLLISPHFLLFVSLPILSPPLSSSLLPPIPFMPFMLIYESETHAVIVYTHTIPGV